MNQETDELPQRLQRALQILIKHPSFEHRAKFKQVIKSFETALDDFLVAVSQPDVQPDDSNREQSISEN
jgi:23S rRNA A2030 N6-methylase RlmJ